MSFSIGVDIGTGSVKALALDVQGKVIASQQLFYEVEIPQPGYSEQDAEMIWEKFLSCLSMLIHIVKKSPSVISFSSYMHGIMAVDADCRPLTKIITWADTRSQAIAQELRNGPTGEKIYRLTGAPIHAMTPLCKIIWWQRNQPDLIQNACKLISIKEFIWYRMFGVFEVDYSIAGAMGLFNSQIKNWSIEALAICGITNKKLSVPVPVYHMRKNIMSQVAERLKVHSDCSFCIGSSDGCAAMIGSNATEEGTAALTIGTSGAIRLVHSSPIVQYPEMIFNYLLENDRYVCGGPVNNGGNIVQWLIRQFLKKKGSTKDYLSFFTSVKSIHPGSDGLIFLPYLNGERAPVWNEKACGIYFGIHEQHEKEHFLRAGLEGICFGLYSIVQQLESFVPIEKINLSGGFTKSTVWVQMLADLCGKTLQITSHDDASTLGAAAMGLKASTLINDYKLLKTNIIEIVKPDSKNHKIYMQSYKLFKNLYESVKSLN